LPVVEKELALPGSQGSVWGLLNNPTELGKCIPGCEEVTVVSPSESRWKLRISVGVIARRYDTRVKLISSKPMEELTYSVESVDGGISAEFRIKLSPLTDSTSKLAFVSNVEAGGSFQWMVNQVIKTQLERFVSQFAACVSAKMKQQ
jgi:hypothetical protein